MEKLLVEDEGHPADLLHFGLGARVPVDEVRSDGDGELPAELLTAKTWRGVGEKKKEKKSRGENVDELGAAHTHARARRRELRVSHRKSRNSVAAKTRIALCFNNTPNPTIAHSTA